MRCQSHLWIKLEGDKQQKAGGHCSGVARILKEERESRHLSMTTVATQAGLSQQMISYVERGARNPTLETLLRMTDALGINLATVIDRASKTRSGKTP